LGTGGPLLSLRTDGQLFGVGTGGLPLGLETGGLLLGFDTGRAFGDWCDAFIVREQAGHPRVQRLVGQVG
jgi:hypothetical protein